MAKDFRIADVKYIPKGILIMTINIVIYTMFKLSEIKINCLFV